MGTVTLPPTMPSYQMTLDELPSKRLFSTKKNICVFDPNKDAHFKTLDNLLGRLVNINWFDKFSRESLEREEISEGKGPIEVLRLRPVVLVIELELVWPKPSWRDGIRLLENLRFCQVNSVKDTVILSRSQAILAAQSHNFGGVKVDWTIPWDGLHQQEIREFLVDIISCAI